MKLPKVRIRIWIASTWFATVAFVAGACAGTWVLGGGLVAVAGYAISALIVTPCVWGLVRRHGRWAYASGAYGGALIGPLIVTLPIVAATILSMSSYAESAKDARGSWGLALTVMFGLTGAVTAIPVGAGWGLVIVLVENRFVHRMWPKRQPEGQ